MLVDLVINMYWRHDVDLDGRLSLGEFPDETVGQRGPLQNEGGQQKVEPDAAKPVALEERHEKPETDEHHDVNVLEHWNQPERNAVTSC